MVVGNQVIYSWQEHSTKKELHNRVTLFISIVRMTGVEPACLTAPDPKSGTSANFATSAQGRKNRGFVRTGAVFSG